ncbi:outer membrane protein 1A/OmpK35 porin [Klebsiella pneumoniae]|nr:outer membrane protein 1A/OmpK35 porin [Klebsiella pneumoniae]
MCIYLNLMILIKIIRGFISTWYYFNKNMNVYAAYKFNQLDDNDYTKAAGVATDDQAAVGIVYQF